ncbi:hypothetical protein B0J11DRAFT_595485 [Dendryphion nanum]|uniref:Uncharacterized protein n=1 Tax=Dendryphion nanum TaxID=256645 RepID=A0A9P9D676_9PLEO|nr:hypothetical protein B0J11DRAFT_595485 [Dendryphion nanum]
MATVSAANYDVYLGFWTNWSQGRLGGATLTLTREDGNLLISFVAIFIALVGKSFWRICCFVILRCLSTIAPTDGLHHQRQAILRNAATPEDGAWRFLQTVIAWRKSARRPFLRLLPLALLGIATFAALLVGGIFSSRLTTDDGSYVLLTGERCGPMVPVARSNRDEVSRHWQPRLAQRSTAYSNHALQCYTDVANPEDCRMYAKPWITTTINRNATCPFADTMCKSKTGNMVIDSGYIDSNYDLGINRPEDERFQMRYVHHCAPIVSQGHKTILNRSNDVPVAQYWYGNATYSKGFQGYTGFTYEVLKNYTNLDLPGYTSAVSARPEYELGAVISAVGIPPRKNILSFEPIPELVRFDADTSLIFLTAQGIGFTSKVNDPWFSATEKWLVPISQSNQTGNPIYLTDEPASALGCTSQVQFCNPNLLKDQQCEPLTGIKRGGIHNEKMWNAKQLQAMEWAALASQQEEFSLDVLVATIGTSALLARYRLANGLSGSLPDNQWQIEVEHLVGTVLASIQGAIVEATHGPTSEELKQFQHLPSNKVAENMCKNQKIRSTAFSSFSMLPLALLLITGTVLVVVDIFLEPVLNAYHTWRAKSVSHSKVTRSAHSRLEWRSMNFLQLQRMAHQGIGSGIWLKTTNETPITLPYQELGILDVRDQKKPLLRTMTQELRRWYTEGDDAITLGSEKKADSQSGCEP